MLTIKVHPVGNPGHLMLINEHDFDAKIHVKITSDAVVPVPEPLAKRRPTLTTPQASTPPTTETPAPSEPTPPSTPVAVSSHSKDEMLTFTHKELLALPEVKSIKSPSQKKSDLVEQILAVRASATS